LEKQVTILFQRFDFFDELDLTTTIVIDLDFALCVSRLARDTGYTSYTLVKVRGGTFFAGGDRTLDFRF
jgi:hypothetical protein